MEKQFLMIALGLAGVGAVLDTRGRRIPNWLTYCGFALALVSRFAVGGFSGLRNGISGMAVGGGVMFVLFLVGGVGGGDVKLMAAVSAWAGMPQTLALLCAAAIAGGVLALAAMLFSRRVIRTLANTFILLAHHARFGLTPHPSLNVSESGALRFPYGWAIALGAVFCVGNSFLRR